MACCKPKIRKNAVVGDWIAGTGSNKNVGHDKLIYSMKVNEKLSFEQYSRDKRFKRKIPSIGKIEERGDNIYYKNSKSEWMQRKSLHKPKDMDHDLKGIYVLISKHYFYFGKNAILIPTKFKQIIKKGPGHKCKFDQELVINFIKWLEENYTKGVNGNPYNLKQILDNKMATCK